MKHLVGGGTCPKCGGNDTNVSESRFSKGYGCQYRKRVCNSCNEVWNTIEVTVPKQEELSEELKREIRERQQEELKIRYKMVYEQRKQNHACVSCGNPSDVEGVFCSACKARRKANRLLRFAAV